MYSSALFLSEILFHLPPTSIKEESCIISRYLSNKFTYFYQSSKYFLISKSWFNNWADYTVLNEIHPGKVTFDSENFEALPKDLVLYLISIYGSDYHINTQNTWPCRYVVEIDGKLELELNPPVLNIYNFSNCFNINNIIKQNLEVLSEIKLVKSDKFSIYSKLLSFKDWHSQNMKIYSLDSALLRQDENDKNLQQNSKNLEPDQNPPKQAILTKQIIDSLTELTNSNLQDFLIDLYQNKKPGFLFIEKANHDCSWPLEILNLKREEAEFQRLENLKNSRSKSRDVLEAGDSLGEDFEIKSDQQKFRIRNTIPGREGIMNIGNSCYISSVLQILLHLPTFKGTFLSASRLFLRLFFTYINLLKNSVVCLRAFWTPSATAGISTSPRETQPCFISGNSKISTV